MFVVTRVAKRDVALHKTHGISYGGGSKGVWLRRGKRVHSDREGEEREREERQVRFISNIDNTYRYLPAVFITSIVIK